MVATGEGEIERPPKGTAAKPHRHYSGVSSGGMQPPFPVSSSVSPIPSSSGAGISRTRSLTPPPAVTASPSIPPTSMSFARQENSFQVIDGDIELSPQSSPTPTHERRISAAASRWQSLAKRTRGSSVGDGSNSPSMKVVVWKFGGFRVYRE